MTEQLTMALFNVNCQWVVISRASLVALLVKSQPAMQETLV